MGSKRKGTTTEGINFLNALLGYSHPIPDAPTTISHRINDKPSNRVQHHDKTGFKEYKKLIVNFIYRNPRCGAKEISSTLNIPHASVQSILTKATISKEVMRVALHDQRGCRPIYVYWIEDERPD